MHTYPYKRNVIQSVLGNSKARIDKGKADGSLTTDEAKVLEDKLARMRTKLNLMSNADNPLYENEYNVLLQDGAQLSRDVHDLRTNLLGVDASLYDNTTMENLGKNDKLDALEVAILNLKERLTDGIDAGKISPEEKQRIEGNIGKLEEKINKQKSGFVIINENEFTADLMEVASISNDIFNSRYIFN